VLSMCIEGLLLFSHVSPPIVFLSVVWKLGHGDPLTTKHAVGPLNLGRELWPLALYDGTQVLSQRSARLALPLEPSKEVD